MQVEKLLEVQPTLTDLGESLTDIIDRVEQAGKETVSIINRNRELQTQITNLYGCRRVLTETIAILDLVQQANILSSMQYLLSTISSLCLVQGHDAVTEGKFHVALRTLRVVKRLRLRSLCTVSFGLYVEKRLPLLVDRLFAATLQVFIIFASSWVAVCLQCLFFTPISVSSLVADFSPRKVFDHRHGFTCSLTRYLTHSPLTRFASHILRSQTSGAEHKCNDPSTALELRPYSCGRHSCH
jgi:hypothetical protein